ncbi:hypothetical protein ACEWY4_002883 [Coilia grayii]|uniref:Uncharacterized protein n=1 Tax=Coilia grayii TaxID=363190 RepID=A0ABD1KPM6_9TELE
MNTCERRARSAEVTSTGIGHKFVHPPPFHSSCSLKKGPLPLSLDSKFQMFAASSLIPTSHMVHNRKPLTGPLADMKCSLAPPHWKTHIMTDVKRRIKDCWALRVLPGPVSEARDNYRGQPAHISHPIAHNHELLHAVNRTTTVPGHFLSTTHRDHRLFDSSELTASYTGQGNPFPHRLTKSAAYSHLPAHKAPFSSSSYTRLPQRFVPVPSGAYTSEYRGNFTAPALPRPLPHQLHAQHVSA